MGTKITEIEPCGKMVVLDFHEIKQKDMYTMDKATKLLLPNAKAADEKKRVYATVYKIGPEVDPTTISFTVGDRVFYNDYDCKIFGDEFVTYGVTKVESIWATYKEDEDD